MAGEGKGGTTKAREYLCRRCNVNKMNIKGGWCKACYAEIEKERRAEDAAALAAAEAVGVSEKLWAMRWVVRHPGEKAEGIRLHYQQMRDKNPKDFEERVDLEELKYAESRRAAEASVEKPLEDEGLERCVEMAERWLRENGESGGEIPG